MYRFPIIL